MHEIRIIIPRLIRRQPGLSHAHPITDFLLVRTDRRLLRLTITAAPGARFVVIEIAFAPKVPAANLLGAPRVANQERTLQILKLNPQITDGQTEQLRDLTPLPPTMFPPRFRKHRVWVGFLLQAVLQEQPLRFDLLPQIAQCHGNTARCRAQRRDQVAVDACWL